MSYIEKSVYDYIRKVVTSGIKALFTKKFLIYTIFFLTVIITTTITALVGSPNINLTIFGISPENMINYIFYFEIAFSIAYIVVGIFLAKAHVILHTTLLILIAAGITTGFYFLDDYRILIITCFVMYCLWMIITVWSALNFSKNIFGSKTTGSILFMGKKEGGKALFSGILVPLIIICMGLNGYVLYEGIIIQSILYITTGVTGIVVGGLIIFAVLYLAKRDDVFFTILPFFYLLKNTHTIQIVFRLLREDVNYISILSIIMSLFFLLNSVSKYYRKVNKLDIDFLPKNGIEQINEREYKNTNTMVKEEWYINDFFKFVSDRGIILVILGFALAYHSMMLQIGFNRDALTGVITIQSGVVQTAHSITLLFTALVIGITILFYFTNKKAHQYLSPQIYRLNFLPPYEDLKKFVMDVRSGTIDWKTLARDASIKIARKGLKSTAMLSYSVKDQGIELAKKGVEYMKSKATTVYDKSKEWGKKISHEGEINDESYNDLNDDDDDF